MGRFGTRRLIWPSSCLRLFTSARLANGRPTPKVLKMWRFVMLLLLFVLGFRSRFTKLRGLLIAGDALDANYVRNDSTLAALRRTACVPLFGAAPVRGVRLRKRPSLANPVLAILIWPIQFWRIQFWPIRLDLVCVMVKGEGPNPEKVGARKLGP